ncbi:MAG: hypothetical protein IKC45_08350 [Clostridia bacterium]|nr:hypothetical protein [Clostridia bacterium]
MSNKRIDLWNTSFSSIAYITTSHTDFSKYDTLVWCEFDDMYKLPKFVTKRLEYDIKPICGVTFRLKTLDKCLISEIVIKCYAMDEEGTSELDYDSEEDMRFQFRIKVMEMTGIVNEMWQRYKKKKPLEIGAILYLAGEKSFADSKLNRDLFYMVVDNKLNEFSLTIQDAEQAALYPSVYNINLE